MDASVAVTSLCGFGKAQVMPGVSSLGHATGELGQGGHGGEQHPLNKAATQTGSQTGEVSPHLLTVPAPFQLWVTAVELWSDTHPTALAGSLAFLVLGGR